MGAMTPERWGGELTNGIPVQEIGEDGSYYVALGHHDPAEFLAAVRALWLAAVGDTDGIEDVTAADVEHLRAVITDDSSEWVISWSAPRVEGRDDAFDITLVGIF